MDNHTRASWTNVACAIRIGLAWKVMKKRNYLHEVLKEKADDLLKDIDIPESLLAYTEEIDISRRQLGVSLEG